MPATYQLQSWINKFLKQQALTDAERQSFRAVISAAENLTVQRVTSMLGKAMVEAFRFQGTPPAQYFLFATDSPTGGSITAVPYDHCTLSLITPVGTLVNAVAAEADVETPIAFPGGEGIRVYGVAHTEPLRRAYGNGNRIVFLSGCQTMEDQSWSNNLLALPAGLVANGTYGFINLANNFLTTNPLPGGIPAAGASLANNRLTADTVDQLIVVFASGFSNYDHTSGAALDLSGEGNAAPTSVSTAARAGIVAAGGILIHN